MGVIRQGIIQRTTMGGGKKLYAVGLSYSNIGEKELLQYMQQNSQVSRTAAVQAVEAFKAAFTTFLMNGHTMQVPSLGTFSLSCNCKMVNQAPPSPKDKKAYSEFRRKVASSIYNIKVRFTPEADIKAGAKSVRFQGVIIDDN